MKKLGCIPAALSLVHLSDLLSWLGDWPVDTLLPRIRYALVRSSAWLLAHRVGVDQDGVKTLGGWLILRDRFKLLSTQKFTPTCRRRGPSNSTRMTS